MHLNDVGEEWALWLAEQRRRLDPVAVPAPAGAAVAVDPLPADPAARRHYLHGRFHWSRRPRESFKALAALEQAAALAPQFAPVHAALADVYNTLGSWEAGALAPAEAFPKAQAAAQRALALDPCCAAAHTSLAYAHAHYHWRWDEAERQFEHALALDPAYAHAHHWRAHLLVAQRRFADAARSGQQALDLQPLDIVLNVHMAWHHWLAREPEAAIEQSDRTAHLDETVHWAPFFRGMACAHCGRGPAPLRLRGGGVPGHAGRHRTGIHVAAARAADALGLDALSRGRSPSRPPARRRALRHARAPSCIARASGARLICTGRPWAQTVRVRSTT